MRYSFSVTRSSASHVVVGSNLMKRFQLLPALLGRALVVGLHLRLHDGQALRVAGGEDRIRLVHGHALKTEDATGLVRCKLGCPVPSFRASSQSK